MAHHFKMAFLLVTGQDLLNNHDLVGLGLIVVVRVHGIVVQDKVVLGEVLILRPVQVTKSK